MEQKSCYNDSLWRDISQSVVCILKMNLELVRLLKFEMTEEYVGDFKELISCKAKDRDLAGANLDIIISIIDIIYTLPDRQLKEWFVEREGIAWDVVFTSMTTAVSDYLRFRHSVDGDWNPDNSGI